MDFSTLLKTIGAQVSPAYAGELDNCWIFTSLGISATLFFLLPFFKQSSTHGEWLALLLMAVHSLHSFEDFRFGGLEVKFKNQIRFVIFIFFFLGRK